jgi:hypothetical protein
MSENKTCPKCGAFAAINCSIEGCPNQADNERKEQRPLTATERTSYLIHEDSERCPFLDCQGTLALCDSEDGIGLHYFMHRVCEECGRKFTQSYTLTHIEDPNEE